jgi:hypothetical protein
MRPTSVAPPVGNPISTQYDLVDAASGRRYQRVTRGNSRTDLLLDGLGRPSATANAVGVKTNVNYDACGRTSYQSLPYLATDLGTTFQHDGLDRLTRQTNPDARGVIYSYAMAST